MQCLLSLEHLEAIVNVVNWSNFNIAMSQGIERPEERDRDRAMASQDTHIH